jgi:hypothetical protein
MERIQGLMTRKLVMCVEAFVQDQLQVVRLARPMGWEDDFSVEGGLLGDHQFLGKD